MMANVAWCMMSEEWLAVVTRDPIAAACPPAGLVFAPPEAQRSIPRLYEAQGESSLQPALHGDLRSDHSWENTTPLCGVGQYDPPLFAQIRNQKSEEIRRLEFRTSAI